MRINPCHACPARHGCDQRAAFQDRARGLGAVSVTFRCGRLAERLRPGARIDIDVPIITFAGYSYPDGEPMERMGRMTVPATVTATRADHRFACVIDPGHLDAENVAEGKDPENLRFRRMARHTRVKAFRDETPLPLCRGGNVQREGKCDARGGACCCHEFDDPCADVDATFVQARA